MQKKTGNAPPEKKWGVSPAGEFPPWRRSTMGGRGAHGAPRGRGGRRGGRGRGRGRGGGRGGASAAADGGAAMGAGSPRTHRPPADARADEPDVQEELQDIWVATAATRSLSGCTWARMTSCTTSTSCRTPSQTHPRSTPPPPAPRTGCLPDVDADKGDSNPGGLQGQPRW